MGVVQLVMAIKVFNMKLNLVIAKCLKKMYCLTLQYDIKKFCLLLMFLLALYLIYVLIVSSVDLKNYYKSTIEEN